jgi:glycerophosphoryl diester phosphodiesterase
VNPWRRNDRPLAIAHRGHSIGAPENTMAAYELAVELGAEMIEADVNITRDGRLAMIHDHTLDRTTTGRGAVSSISWADLQELDAGSWFEGRHRGARVPSADALLAFARDAGIVLCLEVKGANATEARAIAECLVDLLVERDCLETCVVSGYDHEALGGVKARIPALQLAPDRVPDNVAAVPREASAQAERIGATVLQNHHAFLTTELVDTLHEREIAVWSWPTTTEASLVAGIELAVDGLMGDDIGTMLRVLDRLRPRRDRRSSIDGSPPRTAIATGHGAGYDT